MVIILHCVYYNNHYIILLYCIIYYNIMVFVLYVKGFKYNPKKILYFLFKHYVMV
jgi:hypothetical protein